MQPISTITLAVTELSARPEGCSAREVEAASGGKRKAAQASVNRLKKMGQLFTRQGVDGSGFRCCRYFSRKAAADAYVFSPGTFEGRSEWKNASSAKYVHLVQSNPAITYLELTEIIGLTPSGATKTLGRLIQTGHLFAARKMSMAKRRPVNVLFSTEQARNDWQAANPLETLGHREPGWRGEPKPKTPKEPKVKATRSPKKNVKRSALSVVKRKDSRIAEVRAGMSRKAFEPTKPKGDNIAIPHSAAQKVTVRENYPDHKFWIDPNSVPVFRYGSAVAA